MSLSIMLIWKKCFPKSQSISSLGASKRPTKKFTSHVVALFQKSLKWDSVILHAMKPTHNVFRCSATLQPPGVTHRMFRCGHVWADFESLSCSGQCLLMSIYEQRGMTTLCRQGESRDTRETQRHGITWFAIETMIPEKKIRSGRIWQNILTWLYYCSL